MAVRFPDPIHPVDPVEWEINQLFDRIIMCVQQRRVALLTTYRDTRNEIAARPIARARKEQELMAFKAQTEQSLQMNELREFQERLLVEIEQKLAEVRVPHPETRVVFRGICGHLEQVIAGVGEVVEEEVPVVTLQVPFVPLQVPVVPRYEDMRPIVAVGEAGEDPGELLDPHGVAIDENTHLIYVAEWGSSRVSIFSETGEFMNTFTNEEMFRPRDIAIHRDNLYLTDRGVHAVFQFKIEADMRLVASKGRWGTGRGQFYYPSGLSVSTNGDVFVVDKDNHRIHVLDDSLHFQRFITHQTMKDPRDVKLTADEVYVLCNDSPCILVFSHAGEKIRSLITRGTGMQIRTASFFCLDRKQNLLISDYESNEVRIFSKEGTHLHTIGKPGHEVGTLYVPRGIVLTENMKLIIVSLSNDYRLQIFSCQ